MLQHKNSSAADVKLRGLVSFFLLVALVTYGIAGVLGFTLFSLAVLLALSSIFYRKPTFSRKSLILYLIISGIYWALLLRTSVSDTLEETFLMMGPLIPLAILPLLLFFFSPERNSISVLTLGRASMIGILVVLIFVLVVVLAPSDWAMLRYLPTVDGRYEGYHGNAVPFSLVTLCLGCLSLVGWKNETTFFRLLSLLAYLLAAYFVAYLSQVRGATLGALFTIPFALIFILGWARVKLFIFALFFLITLIFIGIKAGLLDKVPIPSRLANSFEYFDTGKLTSSDSARFEMWRLGIEAFLDRPITGYGYSQRFDAIKSYRPSGAVLQFKHLHNDLITVSVAGGVSGLFTGVALLLAPFAAWWIYRRSSRSAIFLAGSTSMVIASVALSNTVLFNDVMPSWLVLVSLSIAYLDET